MSDHLLNTHVMAQLTNRMIPSCDHQAAVEVSKMNTIKVAKTRDVLEKISQATSAVLVGSATGASPISPDSALGSIRKLMIEFDSDVHPVPPFSNEANGHITVPPISAPIEQSVEQVVSSSPFHQSLWDLSFNRQPDSPQVLFSTPLSTPIKRLFQSPITSPIKRQCLFPSSDAPCGDDRDNQGAGPAPTTDDAYDNGTKQADQSHTGHQQNYSEAENNVVEDNDASNDDNDDGSGVHDNSASDEGNDDESVEGSDEAGGDNCNNENDVIPRQITVEVTGNLEPAMFVAVGEGPEAECFFIFNNTVYREFRDDDMISIDLTSPIAKITFL